MNGGIMVNLEKILTVDDLIVEYIVYKVKNGYDPKFLASEFMDFLQFFSEQNEGRRCNIR